MIQWALGMDDTGPVEMWPLPAEGAGQSRDARRNGLPLRFVLDHTVAVAGGVFVCEKGKLEIGRANCRSNPDEIAWGLYAKLDPAEEARKTKADPIQAVWHLRNWLDCIRTRQKPAANVEIGHRSVSIAHLLTITRQLGRRSHWDPAKEQFTGDNEANRLVDPPRRKGYELPKLA